MIFVWCYVILNIFFFPMPVLFSSHLVNFKIFKSFSKTFLIHNSPNLNDSSGHPFFTVQYSWTYLVTDFFLWSITSNYLTAYVQYLKENAA